MPAPIAAQLAAAILGTSLMGADQDHVGELELEAAQMTQSLRELEAQKMRQTIGGLDAKYAAAEREATYAVKIAAAVTAAQGDLEKLAELLEAQGMDKEALGALLGGLARAGGAALKGAGGVTAAAGRLKVPTTGTQRLLAAGGEATKAPGRFAGNTAKLLHAGGETAQTVGAVAQGPGALQRAGGWLQGKGQALAAKGTQAAPAAAAAVPAAATAATAAAPAATRGASKPLISGAMKGKLLAGGALAGAGYVGLKGMQAARDFMMAPGSHAGAPIMQNVNQYGYPQH